MIQVLCVLTETSTAAWDDVSRPHSPIRGLYDDDIDRDMSMAGLSFVPDVPSAGTASVDQLAARISAQYDLWTSTRFPGWDATRNPLEFWSSRESRQFHLLAPVARMCLSILGTSAPIERGFSRAKFWTREERGGTGDDTVSECVSLGMKFSNPEFPLATLFEDLTVTSRRSPHSTAV